ncbi:MAG TPA: sigma-70 family RNA polymerase sigma factor, partial [Pseudomonadales bacterium]|nr:sigma-70 family RNA polymerase sigma factor [Pseudomonadales bacterium]
MRAIAKSRDRAAFSSLFGYFAPRIKTYLMQSGVGQERAEDLVQETMVMAWRKAALYQPEKAAVSTWLFQIARNKLIDHLRRYKYPE